MPRTSDVSGVAPGVVANALQPVRVVFFGVDPKEDDQAADARLDLTHEAKSIADIFRDNPRVDFRPEFAVSPGDIPTILHGWAPVTILHFSGHGSISGELILEEPTGEKARVKAEAFADVVGRFAPALRCVVLNACYSAIVAEALSTYVDIVVGIEQQVDDRVAVPFARAFYGRILRGESVKAAVEMAKARIALLNLPLPEIHILLRTTEADQLPLIPVLPFVPNPLKEVATARLPSTGPHFVGRKGELRVLDDCWEDSATTVISIVGMGGMGKSSLVNRWLSQLAVDSYRGATHVLGWSFAKQMDGRGEASADEFVDWALRRLGDESTGGGWVKGERLAQRLQSQRVLLILDGLESLLRPPTLEDGLDRAAIRDDAMTALLRSLATRNSGLCIITTQIAVADLAAHEEFSAPVINLSSLSPDEGADLLGLLGVTGSPAELTEACREQQGLPIALTLLGTFVANVYGGDVRNGGGFENSSVGRAPVTSWRPMRNGWEKGQK